MYEPTVEIRERTSRSVFIEVPYNVETGEAERIAVDWTAKGGGGGTSREFMVILDSDTLLRTSLVESHLQTQRAAVKMLHERLLLLVQYVTDVIEGNHQRTPPESAYLFTSQGRHRLTMLLSVHYLP